METWVESRRKPIPLPAITLLDLECTYALKRFGTSQKVVEYDVNPGDEVGVDQETEGGRQGYKITSVGARQGHFYFVLTKDAQGFSEKEQTVLAEESWNALEEMIQRKSSAEMTSMQMIVTSICFCEKRKLYLAVMTESDVRQDRMWDTGNKKDENWLRDKERGGYHPTIVFKDPTDDLIWRVVTKDNHRVSTNVFITDVAGNN